MRHTLSFRRARVSGPPRRGDAERDRAGLLEVLAGLRRQHNGPVYAGGHSYGGRQLTMLAAEDSSACDALLVLSYPLHPPNKPGGLRVAHLPQVQTPCLFVHGTRDPFGGIDELKPHLDSLPARHLLRTVEGSGHDLKKIDCADVAAQFVSFASGRF
ncbi:MAG: alpha/beta hydrolase [Bryobacterales bacterium]|nr:alpha/beta hydrolase [Bryobacterales bacterium]